jgi:hypothetical protein
LEKGGQIVNDNYILIKRRRIQMAKRSNIQRTVTAPTIVVFPEYLQQINNQVEQLTEKLNSGTILDYEINALRKLKEFLNNQTNI